ncbi:LacI family DNA-binding transcriptional regulator [Microbacterium sp. NEAU-LLC]|uniref:LacI family DNA-binding transcriptional regulator n=1 Tax=Microbacterium helvum TaxID=2773713 RepID=A0ABR8NJY5_9MICO|nr:LacI family DNA-binding transcriptional regulator [Microbacterium helvum]
MADVASLAGVAVSTASRVLAGRGDVSSATRLRILAAADRLQYRRGDERRGRPRTGTVRLIDLVLGQFDEPWSVAVIGGARAAAVEAGFDLVVTSERDTPEDDWPTRIQNRGSAGVVLALIAPTTAQFDALERAGIPVVLMDPRTDLRRSVPAVGATDRAGGAAAATHLLAAGARRLFIISGEPRYRFGRARIAGFIEAAAKHDPTLTVTEISAPWESGPVREAVREHLRAAAAGGEPIGVFACSDEIAYGVYAAAADCALRIPDDVQVVGFDDIAPSKWLRPPLTTVRQPTGEMAAEAVRLIAAAAAGIHPLPERTELQTELVVRRSTRIAGSPPPAGAYGPDVLLE